MRYGEEEKDILRFVSDQVAMAVHRKEAEARQIKDPKVLEAFKESQRRIRSMALIHERLYQSSDLSRIEFSQYLRNLASHLFHSYQIDARLELESPKDDRGTAFLLQFNDLPRKKRA